MIPEGFRNSSTFFRELCEIRLDILTETLAQPITSEKIHG